MIDLFGWDTLLMAAGIDAEGFGEVANRYASWMQQYMNALAESDAPCVMIHDGFVMRPTTDRACTAEKYGKKCPGFIMAVGNHIPANTPTESCLIYEEAYREMCRR